MTLLKSEANPPGRNRMTPIRTRPNIRTLTSPRVKANASFRATNNIEPRIGPKIVPAPPTKVISIGSKLQSRPNGT